MNARLLVALAALACAGTAFAQETTDDYRAAVEARLGGDPAEAKRLLERRLAANPGDVDARLQLAYAQLALGENAAAEDSFRAVLASAPDYADAREGLALIAQRRGGEASRGYALVEGALSDLNRGAAGWREGAIEFQAPISPRATLGGRAAYYRRFGLDDVELTARLGARVGEGIWLRADLGGTPNADFRPRLGIGAGGDFRLRTGPRATVAQIDVRYDRFPAQEVVTIAPALVQYLGDGRAWVTVRGIGVIADGGSLQAGALLRGDFATGGRQRLFAGISNGPDTDLGIVSRVTSVFAGGEVPLGGSLSLIGSAAREWREGGGRRNELRLGLKTAF